MDWQTYGQQIGLPTTGAMGDYYRPQIEQALANEQQRRSMLGSQPGYQDSTALTGGNSTAAMMQGANTAAGRVPQASAQGSYLQAQPAMQPYAQQTMQTQQMQPTARNPYMPQQAQPAQPMAGQQNPWLDQLFASIQDRATTNLRRNVLPQLGRDAVAAGRYGSGRQGIAEGIAMGDTQRAIADAQAQTGYNAYQFDKNYGLSSDALDLNVFNANQNWTNVGQQNQLNAMDRLLGWNQNYGLGNATNAQNTPMNYWQQFANTGSQLGGMGDTASKNLQGNPWLSAIGGGITGLQLYNALMGKGG